MAAIFFAQQAKTTSNAECTEASSPRWRCDGRLSPTRQAIALRQGGANAGERCPKGNAVGHRLSYTRGNSLPFSFQRLSFHPFSFNLNETQSYQPLFHSVPCPSFAPSPRPYAAHARTAQSRSLPELPKTCRRTRGQLQNRPTRHRFHALSTWPADRVRPTPLRLLLHRAGREFSEYRNLGRRADRALYRSESVGPI